jgi:membrane-bound lytic murein transglycosylase MltF
METIEASNKQDIKKIITATKYLKKIIKRLPKESITEHDKKRLFVQYEELVDVIVSQCQ